MPRRSYVAASDRTQTKQQPQTQISQYSRPFPAPQSIQTKTTDDPTHQPPVGSTYNALTLLPKLTIGAVNDPYEQEADRVAAQVVQQLNAPPDAMQRQGYDYQPKGESLAQQLNAPPNAMQRLGYGKEPPNPFETQPLMQRKGSGTGGITAPPGLEDSIQRERAKGQSLAESIRQPMETAMGADFSGVRIHTDSTANQLSESIQAKAFTTGQDVFFRQGAYAPQSRGGQELFAHELTHVVQQTGAIQPKLGEEVSTTGSPAPIQRDVETGKEPDTADKATEDDSTFLDEVPDTELEAIAQDLEQSLDTTEKSLAKAWPNLTEDQVESIKETLNFIAKLLEVHEVKGAVPDAKPEGTKDSDGPGKEQDAPSYTYLEVLITCVDRLIAKAKKSKSSTSGTEAPSPAAAGPDRESEGMKKAKGLSKALKQARKLSEMLQPLAKLKGAADKSPIGLTSIVDGKVTLNVFGSTITFAPEDQETTVNFPAISLPKGSEKFEKGLGVAIPIAPGIHASGKFGLTGKLNLSLSETAKLGSYILTTDVYGKDSNMGVKLDLGVGAGIVGILTGDVGLGGKLLAAIGDEKIGTLSIPFDATETGETEQTALLNLDLEALIKGVASLWAKLSFLNGLFKKEYDKALGDWQFGTLSYQGGLAIDGKDFSTHLEKMVKEDYTQDDIAAKEGKEVVTERDASYKEAIDLYERYSSSKVTSDQKLPLTDKSFVENYLRKGIKNISAIQDIYYPKFKASDSEIYGALSKSKIEKKEKDRIPTWHSACLHRAHEHIFAVNQDLYNKAANYIVKGPSASGIDDNDLYNAYALNNILENLANELDRVSKTLREYEDIATLDAMEPFDDEQA